MAVEEIKEQINELITKDGKQLSSDEVVKLSRELDKLVVDRLKELNSKVLITK